MATPTHAPSKKLLIVREAAEALTLTVACMRAWILLRRIGYTKIGRNVRIPQTEIDRIISDGFIPRREP